MTNKLLKYNILGIVSASEHEEFFYKDNDEVVPEHESVGVEVEYDDRIDLELFDNIYWSDERLP